MIKYRYYLIIIVLTFITSITFSWSKSMDDIEILTLTTEEFDWYKANIACGKTDGGWYLPSITQLLGLFYFNSDTSWNRSTDYWSDTLISGRGFGLNTKLGILSFDMLRDEDHFICVRDKNSLASL